jgi:branched-chain amino acid transport system substrate-binding protein
MDQELYGLNPDLFDADGMSAAIFAVKALEAAGGMTDAASLRAVMEGMTFEGAKGEYYMRPEDHMAIQDMYVVTLTGFDPDTTFPIYEPVATVRPEPPCLLTGDFLARCGSLPVGSLG